MPHPFRHQPFYCEENVWHLAADPRVGEGERAVVVISNPTASVALWRQRAGGDEDGLVVWDYHVVLAVLGPQGARIWDLDTTLGTPLDAAEYLRETFRSAVERFAPRFRWIAADEFRTSFASDRRHMRDDQGAFAQPPPPWSPIGQGHRLPAFVDVSGPGPGEVLDLAQLRTRLSSSQQPPP